jgi:hypothetical protein
LFTL